MCDPLSAVALAGSAVAAGVNYMGQQDALNAQQQANDDWVAQQRSAAADAAAKDQANRQKAQAALSTSEQKLGAENQTDVQQKNAADLTSQMLAGSPAADNSNVQLLGQPAGGATTSVTQDMASRVTNAAREAQGRIKALAGMTSYGGGYGGMGAAAKEALGNSQEQINLTGDFRKGDTATLGTAQAIQPLHYEQGSNLAGTIADKLGGLAGNAFASKLKGFG